MLQFGIFEACVMVDNAELPEYHVTIDEESKGVTCWIPSKEGKAFTVKVRNTTPYQPHLGVILNVDGTRLGTVRTLPTKTCDYCIIKDVLTSPTTTRALQFSSVELTDDDTFLHTTNAKNLGDISLDVWALYVTERRSNNYLGNLHLQGGKVHERLKKAIGHRVKLGAEKTVPSAQSMRDCQLSERKVTFTFKYRPIDVLRADGIAPAASTTLQPSNAKRKAEELGEDGDKGEEEDEDEAHHEQKLKILLEEVNKLQARLAKKGSRGKSKKIKAESRSSFVPGEVIDLT